MNRKPCRELDEQIDSNPFENRIDQILSKAREHLQSGQLAEAEPLCRRALRLKPDHPTASHFLGVIRLREGKTDAAMKLICKALELNPHYAEAHTTLGLLRQDQGRLSEAADCYRQAVALKPDSVDAHNNLGTVYLSQGRLIEAMESFRRVLALQTDHADAQNNVGVVLLNQGQAAEAGKYFQKAITLKPEHADALNNLGLVLLHQGQLTEATEYFRRAIGFKADHLNALNNLGAVFLNQGRFAESVECFRQVLALNPDHVDAHYNCGQACLGLGRLTDAAGYFRQVLALNPDHVDARNNLGATLLQENRLTEAEECFRQVVAIKSDHVDAHNNLGAVFLNQSRLTEAAQSLSRALALKPDHVHAQNNLGQVLQLQGHLSAAAERFRQVIRLCPEHAEAHRHLVNCYRIQPGSDEIQRIESLLHRRQLCDADKISLGFALGKAYDDIGNYDEAFANYDQANRVLRAHLAASRKHFDVDKLGKYSDELRQAYSTALFSNPFLYGNDSKSMIFVVGMFRSGTSLVEQIISSHSQVSGAGELKNISAIANSLAARFNNIPYPKCVAHLDKETLTELAEGYLGYVRGIAGSKPYVVDKMPNNVWHLGLIALLFPKAKIIHCRRDPRDVCLSCYFQRFTDEGTYYTTDLGDCGRFYLESERLVRYWKSVLPVGILEVGYEELVANQESETRRILEFLGLDWEARCLEFYRTKRIVTTASAWQVRQPVYTRSIARWRHYEKHLQGLFRVLELGNQQVD